MHRIGLVILSLVVVACSDPARPVPGQPCLVNSECTNPLSCTFGKCHEACREARDCPTGQTCVRAPGGNVCVLPEEQKCAFNSMCSAPLVCGRDLECRNQCEADRDCATTTQKCVLPDKVCAEPEDIVNGALLVAPDAGVPDASPDVIASGPGPCGVAEAEPNDERALATTYAPGTDVVACLGSRDDIDYYQVTAPADPAGGYFQGSIIDVGAATVDVRVFSATDNAPLLSNVYTSERGASLSFYWAAAPGQTYRVAVNRWVGSDIARYTFRASFTPVADANEPNDVREQAKPLALATATAGTFFAGFKTAELTEPEYHDWYALTLAAGNATIRVEDVALNVQTRIELYDGNGTFLQRATASNAGAVLVATIPVPTAGPHRLVVWPALAPDASGRGASVPDSFKRAFKLTVTQ